MSHDSDYEARRKAAKKRIKQLRDFYSHVSSYVIIIAMLVVIDLATGGGLDWAFWPALGWGIAVAFHAVDTFGGNIFLGANWEERKMAELMGEKPKRDYAYQDDAKPKRKRNSGPDHAGDDYADDYDDGLPVPRQQRSDRD